MDSPLAMSMLGCEIDRWVRGISRRDETEYGYKSRASGIGGWYCVMPCVNSGRAVSAMVRGMLALLLLVMQR